MKNLLIRKKLLLVKGTIRKITKSYIVEPIMKLFFLI